MVARSHSKLLLQFCPDGSPNSGHTAMVLRTFAQVRSSELYDLILINSLYGKGEMIGTIRKLRGFLK